MSTRILVRDLLLLAYGGACQRGWLARGVGRTGYEWAYDVYKRTMEMPGIRHLQRFVPAGSTVVDVGANIGFFTLRFAEWVGQSGTVIAIEPAPENVAGLARRLGKRGLLPRVKLIEAVAAETDGRACLALNPLHPGDHRISDQGLEVQAVTVDGVLKSAVHPISLIKIDVQGAEMRVLAGARTAIDRFRPVLLVEVDARALGTYGAAVGTLVGFMNAYQYAPHRLTRRGLVAMAENELLARSTREYSDVLFVPRPVHASRRPSGPDGPPACECQP